MGAKFVARSITVFSFTCFILLSMSVSPLTPSAMAQAEEEAPVRLQPDIRELKAIEKYQADYPALAKQAFAEGIVNVEVTVEKDGTVGNVDVVNTIVTYNDNLKKEYKKAKQEAKKKKNKPVTRPPSSGEEGEEMTEEVAEEEEEAEEEEADESDSSASSEEEESEVEEAETDPYAKMALEEKIIAEFEASAIKTAKKWKFEPMKSKDGKPMSVVAPLQFSFSLSMSTGTAGLGK